MKVLVADRLDPAALVRLRSVGHEVVERTGLQGPDLVQALSGCQALIVRSATKVTGEVLKGVSDLKVVVRAGTGLDNVDHVTAHSLGIRVLNTPHANSVAVAELVFALLLAFERHVPAASQDLRAGRWEKTRLAGREIAGRKMGLIGFGRIGRDVALRARVFGMSVSAHDPLVAPWPVSFDWVERPDLDGLLSTADFVSLHLPLESGTRGLIGAKELARMKPEALLINCARGGIVDETALHQALVAGKLRGAILDVFATEPPGPSPLLELPNVLATPHLGASTAEAQRRAGEEAAELVIQALAELATAR